MACVLAGCHFRDYRAVRGLNPSWQGQIKGRPRGSTSPLFSSIFEKKIPTLEQNFSLSFNFQFFVFFNILWPSLSEFSVSTPAFFWHMGWIFFVGFHLTLRVYICSRYMYQGFPFLPELLYEKNVPLIKPGAQNHSCCWSSYPVPGPQWNPRLLAQYAWNKLWSVLILLDMFSFFLTVLCFGCLV